MRRRMMYASQLPSQQRWRLVATLLLPLWFVSACDAQTNDKKESVAPADPATQTAASLPKEQSMSDNNQQVPATASNANAELQQRFAEIKTLIGDAAASDVQQCRKVAFGYKACGGPASYLIYSVQGLDETVLLEKVSQYNALAEAETKRLGVMSDCSIVPEPGVTLVGGFCKAGPAGDLF
jgi:hypothetical protein